MNDVTMLFAGLSMLLACALCGLFIQITRRATKDALIVNQLKRVILITGTNGCGMTNFAESITKGDCTILAIDSLNYKDYADSCIKEIDKYLLKETSKPLIIEHADAVFVNKNTIKELLLKISKGKTPVIFRTQEISKEFLIEFSGYIEHIYLGKTCNPEDYLSVERRDLLIGEVIDINGRKVKYLDCVNNQTNVQTVATKPSLST